MSRPVARKKYYTSNSKGVKRSRKSVFQSMQLPYKPARYVDPRQVRAAAAAMGAPNRNAPLQKLEWR